MGLLLNMEPAAWSGKRSNENAIVYKVLNLPKGMEISIKKDRHGEKWRIVRGGRGLHLVQEGEYGSAEAPLEELRKEFPA